MPPLGYKVSAVPVLRGPNAKPIDLGRPIRLCPRESAEDPEWTDFAAGIVASVVACERDRSRPDDGRGGAGTEIGRSLGRGVGGGIGEGARREVPSDERRPLTGMPPTDFRNAEF